jgi:hypothetical protein
MSKTIEFAVVNLQTAQDQVSVFPALLSGDNIVLKVRDADTGYSAAATFSDPAKLEALADAIKRAADALRKSQRLMFSDLKRYEWFQWDRPPNGGATGMKISETKWMKYPEMSEHETYGPDVVTKLRATFTPEEPTV